MKTPRRSRLNAAPGQAKALAYIDALISERAGTDTKSLPTIKVLAKGAGVAVSTMHKAVRQLVAQGRLSARPRVGLRVVVPSPDAPANAGTGTGYSTATTHGQRIAEALESDIAHGTYRPGHRLPTLKELSDTYGASTSTMRRTLARVFEDGWTDSPVRPRVKRFQRLSGFRASVVCIGDMDMVHPCLSTSVIRMVLRECEKAGARVAHFSTKKGDARVSRPSELAALLEDQERKDSVLGFVLATSGMSADVFDECADYLGRFGKPLSVIDDMGYAPARVPRRPGLDTLVLPLGTGSLPGQAVGRFLVQKGHRKVAFISPVSGTVSSRQRLAGLTKALELVGGEVEELSSGDELLSRKLGAEWRQDWPLLEGFLSGSEWRSAFGGQMATATERAFAGALLDVLNRKVLAAAIAPLVHRALGDPRTTAWVAFNDYTANACKQALVNAGRRVALVGFDNLIESGHEQLTSYDFDGHTIVRSAVGHVLNAPRSRRRSLTPRVLEVDGFVVERESTGPGPSA